MHLQSSNQPDSSKLLCEDSKEKKMLNLLDNKTISSIREKEFPENDEMLTEILKKTTQFADTIRNSTNNLNNNALQDQLSQKSVKEQKFENYESVCSQSLFTTGRGNTIEITAKHFERVLNLLTDSDEEALDQEAKHAFMFSGDKMNSETGGLKSEPQDLQIKAQNFQQAPQMTHINNNSNDAEMVNDLKTHAPLKSAKNDSKVGGEPYQELCQKLKSWNTEKRATRVLKTSTRAKKAKVSRNKKPNQLKLTDSDIADSKFLEEEDSIAVAESKRFKPNKPVVEKSKFMSLSRNVDKDSYSLPEFLNPADEDSESQAFENLALEDSLKKLNIENTNSKKKRNFLDVDYEVARMNNLL